jgi:hypothetical protein
MGCAPILNPLLSLSYSRVFKFNYGDRRQFPQAQSEMAGRRRGSLHRPSDIAGRLRSFLKTAIAALPPLIRARQSPRNSGAASRHDFTKTMKECAAGLDFATTSSLRKQQEISSASLRRSRAVAARISPISGGTISEAGR